MKRILIVTFIIGCGGSASTPCDDDAGVQATTASLCSIPEIGGVPCDGTTTDLVAWTWLEPSATGEVVHRCNAVACTRGATCVVQSDVSGQDDGLELRMGVCQ